MRTDRSLLQTALAYAARDWSVVPLAGRGKRPLVRWTPYQRARAGAEEIRQWFRQWPEANVGIVTGAVSGLVVLDVDPRHGGDAALAELERGHGPLPDTVAATTGGGGRHLYFRHPGGLVRNKVGLAPGIDLRGDGGLVVAPPSLHPSGRRYAWVEGRAPDAAPIAPMPDWLLHLASAPPGGPGHPLRHWRELIERGVGEGERNNTIASLAGYLFWHELDTQVVLDLLLCWNAARCRPPLPADEVARTVESIARLHAQGRDDDGEA